MKTRIAYAWKARLETNRTVTIPYVFKKCDELGLTDNFARAAGFLPADTFQPNSNNRRLANVMFTRRSKALPTCWRSIQM